jgi:serine/threonine-protein kinase RsbW
MSKMIRLSMRNSSDALIRVMGEANVFLESQSLPSAIVYKMNLVLEEVLTNVIKYAFNDSDAHEIAVMLDLREDELFIEVMDDGVEFNPLTLPEPKPRASLLEATEGGLGVYLVRMTVDSIGYRRDETKNVLSMALNLKS